MLVRRIAPATLPIALVLLAGCGGGSSSAADDITAAPTVAPSRAAPRSPGATPAPAVVPEKLKFTGTTLAGAAFNGATLAGKPTVLWFWAPWCPRCRAQAETTAKVANEYQGKANFVGVAGLDKPEAMRRFVEERKVGGFTQLSDESGAIWKRFEIVEQSTFVVLDAQGNKVFAGNLPAAEGLSDKVGELVAGTR